MDEGIQEKISKLSQDEFPYFSVHVLAGARFRVRRRTIRICTPAKLIRQQYIRNIFPGNENVFMSI